MLSYALQYLRQFRRQSRQYYRERRSWWRRLWRDYFSREEGRVRNTLWEVVHISVVLLGPEYAFDLDDDPTDIVYPDEGLAWKYTGHCRNAEYEGRTWEQLHFVNPYRWAVIELDDLPS